MHDIPVFTHAPPHRASHSVLRRDRSDDIVRVIVDWLDEVVEKDVDLCFGEVAENEHGVPIVKQQQLKHTHLDRIMEQPPPLENVRRTLIQYFA